MPRKKKKNIRLFGITSRVLMVIAAGFLVLSYLSVMVNPAKAWGLSLVGLAFVPLSLVNLILLLWAVKRRSKSFVIPLLALLPSMFFLGRYVQFSSEDIVPAQDPELKIVSYNVGRFALQDAKVGVADRRQCADSIFAFLRSQEADVVCLQEFRISDMDKVRSYLRRQMKGYRAEFYMFPMSDGSAFGNVTPKSM